MQNLTRVELMLNPHQLLPAIHTVTTDHPLDNSWLHPLDTETVTYDSISLCQKVT